MIASAQQIYTDQNDRPNMVIYILLYWPRVDKILQVRTSYIDHKLINIFHFHVSGMPPAFQYSQDGLVHWKIQLIIQPQI